MIKNVVLGISLTGSITLLIQALYAGSAARLFLPIFFAVGLGLGLLRLFVNHNIKKMKGKSIMTKILFFAVLLGVGLPFQSWFRTNVMFAMDPEVMPRSIAMMVMGVVSLTVWTMKSKKQEA
ncbi:MFS transporter permease [Vagococcus xieshaowenii]|uniref:MFS transporter permease n=2 Tax=Vagococcus xieshaowenii TaxID=2562451 RepID=A0AAJ5JLB8_9ENTE|nr:MFS transporter permease [Vagococcus xieshaowenii]TFZ41290.1 MFS transporter permease [Vagococcus xieshaowenii]